MYLFRYHFGVVLLFIMRLIVMHVMRRPSAHLDSQSITMLHLVCNRTWLGDTGKTYEIELDKPKTLPFICHFNLTAAGGYHGDIIQVSLTHRSEAR